MLNYFSLLGNNIHDGRSLNGNLSHIFGPKTKSKSNAFGLAEH